MKLSNGDSEAEPLAAVGVETTAVAPAARANIRREPAQKGGCGVPQPLVVPTVTVDQQ